jgi:hypothetical protein
VKCNEKYIEKNLSYPLVSILVAVATSTAFVVSLSPLASAALQVSALDEFNERKYNGHYQTVSTQHQSSDPYVPSLIANGDDLNQTKVTELRIALHDLWVEHIVWTRQYIVAAAADQPDASFAAERLMRNQEEIGNAIKPLYGDQAGNQLTSQLKDHILIAVDLLEAAKAGDSSAVQQVEQKWYANADEIATFLSGANPNWTKDDLLNMVNEHLSLTKTEAVARLTGDYATDVTTFDALYQHAVSMGDEFTIGIVNQFQELFV